MPQEATADNATVGSSSALEALEKASAAAESVPSTGSPSSAGTAASASASTPGATTPAASGVTEDRIPLDRHEAAVRNARDKADQEWKGKVGWAESLNRDQVTRALTILQRLDGDPKAFLSQLQTELTTIDPNDPDPDLVSQDGKHKAYSADAVKQIIANTVRRLQGEVKPIRDWYEQQQHDARLAQLTKSAQDDILKVYSDFREQNPWMKGTDEADRLKIEQAIGAKIAAMQPDQKTRLGTAGTLMWAAGEYYRESVLPTLQATAKDEVLHDSLRKAAASTGTVGPAGSAPTRSKRPRTADELAAHIAQMPGASEAFGA